MKRIAMKRVIITIHGLLSMCEAMNVPVPNPKKILVTGAAGRTGKLVFSQLLDDPNFQPIGLVRTENSAKKLLKDINCSPEAICVCDVTQVDEGIESRLSKQAADSYALVICTSAVPKLSKVSILKEFLRIPINLLKGKKAFNFRSLRFTYSPGQYPEKVDYMGQIAQIELAKKMGVKHVVIVR
jgi:nucleoside-diphosphate-sugar epimerase